MRVPASVQVAMVGTGLLIALGASGCSKGVEQPTAAETALAADVLDDTNATDKAASHQVDRDRDSLSKTDLRSPDLRSEREDRGAPGSNAWMFRGSGEETQQTSNATPVSTQASILPPQPTQPPAVVQPPKTPPPKLVNTTRPPPRPPGWQIRAACGRG